jgi:hypothetical protein
MNDLINFRSRLGWAGPGSSYLNKAYEKKILAPALLRSFSKCMYFPSKKDIAVCQQQYPG